MAGTIGRRDFIVGAAGMGLGALRSVQAVAAPSNSVSSLLSTMSTQMLDENPETATSLGVDKGKEAVLKRRLTDRSPAGVDKAAAGVRDRLALMRRVDIGALEPAEAIDVRATMAAHELADEAYRQFGFGDNLIFGAVGLPGNNSPYAFSQGTGFFATIPDFLVSQHKIDTANDADAYLARLVAFARGLDGESERLRRDAAAGVSPPDFILDTVINQERATLALSPATWRLVSSLQTRTASAGIQGEWGSRARTICERDVAPAIARQIAALEAVRKGATAAAGCWKFPEGDAYYSWSLRAGTTTAYPPDEVHRLGLEQVAMLNSRMDALLRQNGLTKGSVGERLAALSRNPAQLYADSDAGRAALIAYLNKEVASVRTRMPRAFFVDRKVDVVIKRVPPAAEAGAPEGYQVYGAIDGSRPSYYYINLRDMANWPRFSLPTLCFHEAIPGHSWQGSYANHLPLIRSQFSFNAYVEGWGLYAEQLADELGMYENDPLGKVGYLQSIQFRACRLVVDTGLHAKRWTRDQAIQWMIDQNGLPPDSARAEIDRYCVWPGQACGYQIGQLEIVRLREKVRAGLGNRFDVRRFHETLLKAGPVPLSLLAEIIDKSGGVPVYP